MSSSTFRSAARHASAMSCARKRFIPTGISVSSCQEDLVGLLRQIDVPGAKEIEQRWAEAASSKTDPNEVKPIIQSPMEGGGM